MTDETLDQKEQRVAFNVARGIVLSGWALCMVISFVIISASVYFMVRYPEQQLPSSLKDWSSVVLGWMFGTFMTVIKDFAQRK